MIETKLVENKNELLEILRLQEKNHYSNLSEDIKTKNGFVTVRHTIKTLEIMNSLAKQIVAVHKNKIIGYALVMTKEAKEVVPILKPMFLSFEHILYKGKILSDYKYYVMGQICIDEAYRGQGIFGKLYLKHKEVYNSSFDLCLTEVSTSNARSMRAHEKVGFKNLKTYKDGKNEWNILCWDWT